MSWGSHCPRSSSMTWSPLDNVWFLLDYLAIVGVDLPKVTVSCRLGAYWLSLGYSTTERVLSSVCESRGAHSQRHFCFLIPHPRGCRTTDDTRTKHSKFDCVSVDQAIRLCVDVNRRGCTNILEFWYLGVHPWLLSRINSRS